jgi:hypothetical protein
MLVAGRLVAGHYPVMPGVPRSPSHSDLVDDLRTVREKGLGHLRGT